MRGVLVCLSFLLWLYYARPVFAVVGKSLEDRRFGGTPDKGNSHWWAGGELIPSGWVVEGRGGAGEGYIHTLTSL